MNHELIALDDERAADPTLVGAKAAGLARLVAAGFAVPDAVVLPAGLRDRWPTGPAPEPIRAAVEDACTALGPRLAVRSSSTWEDGATAAHAGATATVLDVSGPDAVLDAIRHCLDADDVAARAEGTSGDVAIVLQRLVDADHAGVAFTADPLTGERGVVRLAATAGLGEALVQGEVVGSDVTVRGDAVDGDLADLPAEHARAVAAVARDVEAALGATPGHRVGRARRRRAPAAGPTDHDPARRAHPADREQLAEGHRPLPRAADAVRVVGDRGVGAGHPQRLRRDGAAGAGPRGALRRRRDLRPGPAGVRFGRQRQQATAGVRAGPRRPCRARAAPTHRSGAASRGERLGPAVGRRVARHRPRRDGPASRRPRRRGPRRPRGPRPPRAPRRLRGPDPAGHPDPLPPRHASLPGDVPAPHPRRRRARLGRRHHRRHARRPLAGHPGGRGRHGLAARPHPPNPRGHRGPRRRPRAPGGGAACRRPRPGRRALGVGRRARVGHGQLRRRRARAGRTTGDALPAGAERARPRPSRAMPTPGPRRPAPRYHPSDGRRSTRPSPPPAPCTAYGRTTPSWWETARWRCCAAGCSRSPTGSSLEAPSRPPPTPPTSRSRSCATPWPATTPRA